MEKVGIEVLKSLADWTVEVIQKVFILIEKDAKGKKVNGWDSIRFVKPLFEIIRIVGEHKELGKEWLDLDEEEKTVLNTIIKEGLELEDNKAEEISERLFYILMEVGDFITDLTKK